MKNKIVLVGCFVMLAAFAEKPKPAWRALHCVLALNPAVGGQMPVPSRIDLDMVGPEGKLTYITGKDGKVVYIPRGGLSITVVPVTTGSYCTVE